MGIGELAQWVRARANRFRSPSEPNRAWVAKVFELIYGRMPTPLEEKQLLTLSGLQEHPRPLQVMRAIINGFDHQRLNTPFTIRFSMDDIEYVPFMGIKFAIDKTDLSVGLPLKRGDFEPHLMKFYMDQLRAGMTFIDVGANIGIYSMLAAKLVGQEGRVLSFEPNSENCRLIMLSAHRNGFRNVTLFPLALGNDVGHVLFSTHIGSNGGLIPDSHLSHDSCVVVPILRLDDLVETRVDCIKMDVEGAEGLVSKGASRLIKKHRPIITSEFSLEMLGRVSGMAGTDYLRYFESKDYNVFLIERSSGRLSAIHDIESFVRNYGEQTRIVDLAFLPK